MAFSKQPTVDTSLTKRVPITTGNTLTSDAVVPSAYKGQRFINCYPKRIKQDNADDSWVVTKIPSIVSNVVAYTSSGTDTVTSFSTDGKYLWKGHRLYLSHGGSVVHTAANSADRYFSMYPVTNTSVNPLYAGLMVDNTGAIKSYTWDDFTSTETRSSSITFLRTPLTALKYHNTFYNGKIFALGNEINGSKRIYNSTPGAYNTWASTDFIVPEFVGDSVVGILVYKNYLVAFGTQSIEFFYDSAVTVGSPLSRQENLMIKQGIKESYNIAQAGDNLFYISWDDRFGIGIYKLEDFKPVKVSDTYVDSILNNTDLITGLGGIHLEMIDIGGDLCVAFPVSSNANETVWMALSTKHRNWFSISLPATIDTNFWYFVSMPNNISQQYWETVYINQYTTDNIGFYKFTKDYASVTSSIAEIVFDTIDFGNQYKKHIKGVDVIGDFGNNVVELAWTPYQDYTNWSSFISITPNTIGHNNTVRFRNLGLMNNFSPRLRITGTNNMVLKGLEINYNLRSW